MTDILRGVPGLVLSHATGWDHVGDFDIQLYNAVLKMAIGPFKVGDTIEAVHFALLEDEPQIILYQGENLYTVPFSIVLGECVDRKMSIKR